ncbi:MAG: hypothetical protein C4555_05040 [Dehalococcoidia bacterium]|nr:MAG: hypothetical protein C4555_05040 [Dehalococcoidia bacterium]
MNKRVNIIYISLTGITDDCCKAVAEGVREAGGEPRLIKANESKGVSDVLDCDAVVFGTGNYFGYMEGMLKHWYDLYQIPVKKAVKKGDLPWKPYFNISTGGWNVDKPMVIMEYLNWGMRLKKVFPYVTYMGKGPASPEALAVCRERGRQLVEVDVNTAPDLYQPTERQLKAAAS